MLQAAFDHEGSFLILPKPEKLNFNEFLRFKVMKTVENYVFSKKCRKTILQHAILSKQNAAKTAILSVLSQTFQNDMAISRLSPLYQNLSEVRCTMYASNFSDLAPSGASWLRLNSAYARFGSDQEDNPK